MFANRFVRSVVRAPVMARNMSAASTAPRAKGQIHREKTLYEAWTSDVGAYPVMSVIVFAVVFAGGAGLYIACSHPDARWSKTSRNQIFRGDLREEK